MEATTEAADIEWAKAGPTPADWRRLHRLRDRWNAKRLDAGRAPLPDDDLTRRLLVLVWRDRWQARWRRHALALIGRDIHDGARRRSATGRRPTGRTSWRSSGTTGTSSRAVPQP